MKKILQLLSAVGPGIFAIGYTIGTGSVTSMAKAGADYGLGLLWVLALSCLFSCVLMTAYGRFAAVTGETSLHGIVRYLPQGRLIAALIFIGVAMGQYTCLGGIMILTSGAIKEAFGLSCGVFPIACIIMAAMYALVIVGRCANPITDYRTLDNEPVRLIVFLAADEKDQDAYLKILGSISVKLKDKALMDEILAAPDQTAIFNILNR